MIRQGGLQARGFASTECIAERSLGFRVGVWGTKHRDQARTLNRRRVLWANIISTFCQKGLLRSVWREESRSPGGFGSFVQTCLHPPSGVTWLGCDAAMPGGPLDDMPA